MHKLFQRSATPLFVLTLSTLAGCGGGSGFTTTTGTLTDSQLRTIISDNNLTGQPLAQTQTPDISSPAAQLGMRLFYSKSLGGDRDSACVSCHHPSLGGGDRLSLPVGVEAVNPDLLGPGRLHAASGNNADGGPTVPRNAPTTFNLAGWDQVLFHDGRVESLAKLSGQNGAGGAIRTPDSLFAAADFRAGANLAQAQARFPVTSREEMKGFNHDDKNNQQIRDFLAQRLGGYGTGAGLLADSDYWLQKFRAVYNAPAATADQLITEQTISFLIGEYERSQVFVDTPWKRYVEGNNGAISDTAKAGALLFFKAPADGGAGCSRCHSGDFFTDEGFHNLAMPQIGRGKGDGDGSEDFGRFRESGVETDKYAFRTPSLLNVEVTGPWSHAGAYSSLEAVVRHHLNPQNAIDNYDVSQLVQTGIQNLDKMQINTQKAINAANFEGLNLNFTDTQVSQLVAFLKTLTDPCVKDRQCLAPWILDSTDMDADPNGDQLVARDNTNTEL